MSVPFNLYCSQLSKGRKILIISISGNQSNTLQVHQASATGHRASSVIKQSVAPYATQNDSPVRMLTNKSALARAAVTRSGMSAQTLSSFCTSAAVMMFLSISLLFSSTGRDLSACVLSHLAKLTTACMNLCSDSLNFGQPQMVQSFLNWVKAISMFFTGLLCRSRWASRNFAPATALVSNRSCSFSHKNPSSAEGVKCLFCLFSKSVVKLVTVSLVKFPFIEVTVASKLMGMPRYIPAFKSCQLLSRGVNFSLSHVVQHKSVGRREQASFEHCSTWVC